MGSFYPTDRVIFNIDGVEKTITMNSSTDQGSNIEQAQSQIDPALEQFDAFSIVSSVIDEPTSATSHIDTQLKFNNFESDSIAVSFFDSGNVGNQSPLTSSINTIKTFSSASFFPLSQQTEQSRWAT
jgi:hypothetical protein